MNGAYGMPESYAKVCFIALRLLAGNGCMTAEKNSAMNELAGNGCATAAGKLRSKGYIKEASGLRRRH